MELGSDDGAVLGGGQMVCVCSCGGYVDGRIDGWMCGLREGWKEEGTGFLSRHGSAISCTYSRMYSWLGVPRKPTFWNGPLRLCVGRVGSLPSIDAGSVSLGGWGLVCPVRLVEIKETAFTLLTCTE